ncbi:ribbon-helix-helix domain-containing protein [Methanonatronarchaeum sp. AMET-Sl]|uniref:ribbon-helix-helix domain-containing protein n=1 Tax=Methanonatronarchaeum sp. AMET-Sl TaxID=3037654 RepID=UPI00244DCC51|nr:ribbon-helix-helix domain-containing protein [Methanonatronarchaeum sp. AMET-Sl]WGI17171.1 ribbon-helix-helix domain-containing protein [Methanonatronarchaeum sp. AMET-Sl]
MTKNKGQQINVRFNQYTIEKIEKLIQQGKFPNKSELIRTAVQRLITEQELQTKHQNKTKE